MEGQDLSEGLLQHWLVDEVVSSLSESCQGASSLEVSGHLFSGRLKVFVFYQFCLGPPSIYTPNGQN